MAKGYLFDTNIWICYFSNDKRLQILNAREQAIKIIKESDVYLSIIVLAELLQRSRRTKKDIKIRDYLREVECLPTTRSTAEIAGDLASNYAKKGQNLSIDDCLIAANAIENGLKLFTADARFKIIKELDLKLIEI